MAARIPKRDIGDLSADLFGNRHRIAVGSAISELDSSDSFSAKSLAESTGVFYARVQEDLKRLQKAGLLTTQSQGGRTVEYVAKRTSYWAMCKAIESEFRSGKLDD